MKVKNDHHGKFSNRNWTEEAFSFHKRETTYTWIKKQRVDISFLQETYSSQEIENHFLKAAMARQNACVRHKS